MFPDKTTEIHLYCRSGGRAGRAMNALEDAGYTNVSNAGGIEDAREARALGD
jgi:phage shock protein E